MATGAPALSFHAERSNCPLFFSYVSQVVTTVADGQYSWISSVEIQSDGKIVAVGKSQFNTSNDNACGAISGAVKTPSLTKPKLGRTIEARLSL